MNIFLFSTGLGAYSVQLAQGLSLNNTVTILLNDRDAKDLRQDFPSFFSSCPFTIIEAPHYKFPDPRKFRQIHRMLRRIRQHETQVIHVQASAIYTEEFVALWLAHRAGLPLVATLHDTRLHPGDSIRLHSEWLHFKLIELCSQIIVHGTFMAEDLIENYGIDERMINIIPHGNYDIYKKSQWVEKERRPTRNPAQVLFFGRMKRYKGLDILMQAAAIAVKDIPELTIVVAGRGPELDRLAPQLRHLPYFDIRNQYIPAGEASKFFAESSLLILPYIEASQSGPLHLAYTWELPVIATRVGAIPESLTHEKEGLLVPPNDPETLAQAIIRLLKHPETARMFGAAGRKKADKELNWSGPIRQKTLHAYEKAINMKMQGISYPGIGAQKRWEQFRKSITDPRKQCDKPQ